MKLVRYMRKPTYVQAIQVTAENMIAVSEWCGGAIRTTAPRDASMPPARYIKAPVEKARTKRETMAFEGDWVLQTEHGFKVYTEKAFGFTFMSVERSDQGSVIVPG